MIKLIYSLAFGLSGKEFVIPYLTNNYNRNSLTNSLCQGILLCFLILSCATVDVEKNAGGTEAGRAEGAAALIVLPKPEVIVMERPVFVPEGAPLPSPAASGEQAVRESNSAGIIKPQDFSHAAIVYDYHPDWVYEVYAQPLRVSNVCLEPGERVVEPPFVSDSERWVLGAGVSYSNGVPVQHIYVKPVLQGITASLIINTDRRVYHVILRSFQSVHMPIVRWRYSSGLPNNYLPQPQIAGVETDGSFLGIDPRFLSFNYRITYGRLRKPSWLPTLVFDDGSKTYITFPKTVLQREFPAVFENRRDVLNYRVIGNLAVVDKLIENITIKIERSEVTISKKRGSNGR